LLVAGIARRTPTLSCCAGILLASSWAAVTVAGSPARAPANPDAADWRGWGNTLRFDRFSPAGQINTANVAQLRPVWKYVLNQKGNWEVTPIVVDGTMYALDMQGTAFALDPETGRELWRFSAGVQQKMRGVAYWPGDAAHPPRIILAVRDRIYALDARTGQPAPGFGGALGYINIRQGFADPAQWYDVTSPPTIFRNLLITGPGTQEFGPNGPTGGPRAYDVITGQLIWHFNTVPHPGERNAGSWGAGWQNRAGTSSWGMMSVDEETGMVFIPTGNPADSFIGTDRPGDNLYANCIVALDAASGTYRWHFQIVHHDLFDYDAAAAPALVDLRIAGKRVPALVEVSKQGLMFILDRRTGKSVFGVEERPVPRSTIPGEQSSPTQPFPLKPAPLARMGMTRADISTITPEAQRFCTDLWNRLGLQDTGPFTPARLDGPSLYLPSNIGGAGGVWGGVSIDPRSGYIFVNTNNIPAYAYIIPDDGTSGGLAVNGYRVDKAYTKLLDQHGLPCVQPPWGEMIAVDGNTGEIAWRRPLGSAEVYGDVGAHTGMISLAGSLATAGGLVFIGATGLGYIGATAEQPVFRAFDSRTGVELWSVRMSSPAESSPMSFVGKSGRQYIVVASSGSIRPDGEVALIAFALPRAGDPPVDLKPAPLPEPSSLPPTPAAASNAIVPAEELPAGSGREDLVNACGSCHALSAVTVRPRSSQEWTAQIEQMRQHGAKVDDAAAVRIRDYLVAHFGVP
jgi:quinoprotein glucose dehydrogenase